MNRFVLLLGCLFFISAVAHAEVEPTEISSDAPNDFSLQVEQPKVAVVPELLNHALSLIGVRYKFGGISPEHGLDCSGLVAHVFSTAAGMVLLSRAPLPTTPPGKRRST